MPALLEVMETLTGEHDPKTQLITATHSPLVLASIEARFDEARIAALDAGGAGRWEAVWGPGIDRLMEWRGCSTRRRAGSQDRRATQGSAA